MFDWNNDIYLTPILFLFFVSQDKQLYHTIITMQILRALPSLQALLLLLAICVVREALSCGCYGPGSCNLEGQIARCTIEGVCDCCAVCNTCDQLFGGCAAGNTQNNNLQFQPPLPPVLNLGQTLGQYFIVQNEAPAGLPSLFFPPCVRPDLPSGLVINVTSDGRLYLTGSPAVITPPTNYLLKARGGVEVISTFSFNISVVETTGSSCPPTGCLQEGFMQCASATTYQTCSLNASGTLAWGPSQNCNTSLTCTPSGNYIYCV